MVIPLNLLLQYKHRLYRKIIRILLVLQILGYQQTFDLSKALTIEQYEAMYSYYDADSMEAKYLKDQLEQLKDMTYANFNYAQSFNSFKNDYSSSGAAGTMTSSGFSGGGGGGAF